MSPVMYAAILGNSKLMQYLLANGADMDAKNINGQSATIILQSYQNQTYNTVCSTQNIQYYYPHQFLTVNDGTENFRKSSNVITPPIMFSPQISPITPINNCYPHLFFPSVTTNLRKSSNVLTPTIIISPHLSPISTINNNSPQLYYQQSFHPPVFTSVACNNQIHIANGNDELDDDVFYP